MSYSLGGWDQLIPQSEGAAPQTYRYTVSAVRNLPSGSDPALVPQRVALFMGNAGFDYWNARWGPGGTLLLRYRARRGTPAYGSGVDRRRMVEAALAQAAQSLGPSVRFGGEPSSGLGPVSGVSGWLAAAVIAAFSLGAVVFVAGMATARRPRVRANRRRR